MNIQFNEFVMFVCRRRKINTAFSVPPWVQAPRGDNNNSLAQPENTYRRITLQKHKKNRVGRQTDGRTDRETDRQTDGNGRPISSYSRGHERSKKCKSRESADGLYYNTSFAYAWEVIMIS